MKLNIAVAALCCSASAAFAGGFERSGMPLGFMFEKGSYVLLGVETLDATPAPRRKLLVTLPEAEFMQQPLGLHQPVRLSWRPEQAHVLAASSV